MKIQIKHRYTGDVIFESEAASVKLAVVDAVGKKISLAGADLSNQDLSAIELSNGNFDGSSFDRSSFDGSSFVGSSFDGSRFDGSSFVGSSFDGSRFDGSSFDRSSFDRSSFVGSSFDGSSFDGSSFDGSTAESLSNSWPEAKIDLWNVLYAAPREVPALLETLRSGRVDGSAYEGKCACLVGTIANLKGCNYANIKGLAPNANRPAELWFLAISQGQTPENNPIAKITCEWIAQWQRAQGGMEAK